MKLTTTSLVPKLVIAGAAEKRNGILTFSDAFKAHIITHMDCSSESIDTVSRLRNVFGQYDPSLASLKVDELIELMALLLFQFEAMKAAAI